MAGAGCCVRFFFAEQSQFLLGIKELWTEQSQFGREQSQSWTGQNGVDGMRPPSGGEMGALRSPLAGESACRTSPLAASFSREQSQVLIISLCAVAIGQAKNREKCRKVSEFVGFSANRWRKGRWGHSNSAATKFGRSKANYCRILRAWLSQSRSSVTVSWGGGPVGDASDRSLTPSVRCGGVAAGGLGGSF